MPLYEYICTACGARMEVLRSMARMDEDATCTACGQPARRVLSVFAAVSRDAAGEGHAVAGGGCAGCAGGGCACAAF